MKNRIISNFKSTIYDILYYKNFAKHKENIKLLKNIHIGKRCFILGNGPSLKKQNILLLKDEYTFVTNHFVHHEKFNEINPNFYCASDTNFFKPKVNDEWYEKFKSISKSVKLFFTYRASNQIHKEHLFKGFDLYYLRYHPKKIWEYKQFSSNVEDCVYTGDTVIIDFCIPLAIYMGFSEIYLLGVDSNYTIDIKNNIEYAFDSSKVTTKRSSNEHLRGSWVNNVTESYMTIKNNAEVKIYDATLNGKLNVFEKINLEEVLSKQ